MKKIIDVIFFTILCIISIALSAYAICMMLYALYAFTILDFSVLSFSVADWPILLRGLFSSIFIVFSLAAIKA